MEQLTKTLQVAQCERCKGYSYPPNVPGCRHCGAAPDHLTAVECAHSLTLRNFVTVHAELVVGLTPPYVIGEVEIAPGLVEEVRLDRTDESGLELGMPVVAAWADNTGWLFRPLNARVDT